MDNTKIEIITNGTICSPGIVASFEKFCSLGDNRIATIRISNDIYHSDVDYESAFTFYKTLVDEANSRIVQKYSTSKIILRYVYENNESDALYYSGRAVNLINNAKEKYSFNNNAVLPFCYKHRIKIIEDNIPCALQISANGGVCFYEIASYNQLDNITFGNILEQNLTDIIDKHNQTCTLLCSEAVILYSFELNKQLPGISISQKDFRFIMECICRGLMNLRQQACTYFPHIPAQKIIESLPFPDAAKLHDLMFSIYEHCPYYTENLIFNIQKYLQIDYVTGSSKTDAYMGAMYAAIRMYLKDRHITRKWPYYLFGTKEDIMSFLNKKFFDLEEYFTINPGEVNNKKVFLCEPNKYFTIDYSEEIAEKV